MCNDWLHCCSFARCFRLESLTLVVFDIVNFFIMNGFHMQLELLSGDEFLTANRTSNFMMGDVWPKMLRCKKPFLTNIAQITLIFSKFSVMIHMTIQDRKVSLYIIYKYTVYRNSGFVYVNLNLLPKRTHQNNVSIGINHWLIALRQCWFWHHFYHWYHHQVLQQSRNYELWSQLMMIRNIIFHVTNEKSSKVIWRNLQTSFLQLFSKN